MEDTTAAAAPAASKPELTPQELIAKGLAPIKREYLAKRLAPRKVVEAVGGTAVNQQGQDIKAKSRRQVKKDRNELKSVELCNNFTLGRCDFGSRCKFNHDVALFCKHKGADLPGSCPFGVLGKCPFGVSCRWALSHTYSDPLQDQLKEAAAAAEAVATTEAVAAAPQDGSEAAAGQTAAPGDGDATAAATTSDVATAATSASGPSPPSVPQASVAGPGGQVLCGEELFRAGSLVGCLPRAASIEKPVNHMSKDLQVALWKNRYDFSRSDAVLKEAGHRISFKPSGNSNGPAQKRARKDPPGASSSKPAGAAATPAAPAVVATEVANGNGAATTTTTSSSSAEPQPATSAAAPPAAAGPAAGPDAAVVAALAAETPTPGASGSQAAVAAGDGMEVDTAPSAAAAAPAAPAAAAAGVTEARAQHVELPLRPEEKKVIDFKGKTYLAPLTTVGNLPFRRLCKGLGADITCGEMAMCTNLLQGQTSEWALLKRHPSEDIFGVQVCGGYPDAVARCCQVIDENISCDFVDVNMGCPIDLVCDKGAGSGLLLRPKRMEDIARAASKCLSMPLTLKTRKAYYDGQDVAHTFIPQVRSWGAAAMTLHGRTRQQRYSKQADWEYITRCAASAPDLQLVGNGDVFSFTDWNAHLPAGGPLATCMVARGALIKPWIFTEIKEQRHWDISASERLDLLKSFAAYGLEHWGSDTRGVENTRRFLLEWLSFTCRYIPAGLLEVVPQQMHWRPPAYVARNDLECLLSSDSAQDWVRISEMLLGPAPDNFSFAPKHKSNAYAGSEADMAMAFGDDFEAQG